MLSSTLIACRFQLHRWQYETKGHAFKGFVYPVSYRACKCCKLAQVKIMDKETDEVIWQVMLQATEY
jgi:hypothetical protein